MFDARITQPTCDVECAGYGRCMACKGAAADFSILLPVIVPSLRLIFFSLLLLLLLLIV